VQDGATFLSGDFYFWIPAPSYAKGFGRAGGGGNDERERIFLFLLFEPDEGHPVYN
jgi:hypothetical protein